MDVSDNITVFEKPAAEPYKLPAPEVSENVDAWIDYFYDPPDNTASLLWPAIITLFFGLTFISWGVYKWLKKKETK